MQSTDPMPIAARPRVAAVVVTFNRKDLVGACLDRLIHQTRPLDEIFVIDNASTDGTREALEAQDLLAPANVTYVRMERNTGGAGGFHEGMRRAHEAGHDWTWIMDDDGEPDVAALEKMERHFGDEGVAVLLPNIDNPDAGVAHRAFFVPRKHVRGRTFVRPVRDDEWEGRDTLDIESYSFVGPCYPRWVIDRIGLPIADFFIHYDDVEYAMRASTLGRAVMVTDAWIRHKEQAKVNATEDKKTAGRQSRRVRYDALWLRYFGYRNFVYLVARGRIDAPRLPLFATHIRMVVGTVLQDDHKWQRFRFWNGAFIDGLLGRFDNDKPKRLLRLSARR
jgi:rhamnopyranosyl-N-acetylglucosaminyl-diphospho-decaprenol beta-1,3/1,4-galactofuranosyltransferase